MLALWTHCYKSIKIVIDSLQLDMQIATLELKVQGKVCLMFFFSNAFIHCIEIVAFV